MSGIYWLASYPKSGNTWMRVFLENYRQDASEPIDINTLPAGTIGYRRDLMDEWLGVNTSEMSDAKLDLYRPLVYEKLQHDPKFRYVKTHEKFRTNDLNEPVYSKSATAGVLLIVRNPFDVAVSFASFMKISVDEVIEWMADEAHTLYSQSRSVSNHLEELVGSWSGHAESWLTSGMPLHLTRYEDLLDDPMKHFGHVVNFMGYPDDFERLERAIEHSRFDRLKAQESQQGFRELLTGAPMFFRVGQAGSWRDQLTSEQVDSLQVRHSGMLNRLGYGT